MDHNKTQHNRKYQEKRRRLLGIPTRQHVKSANASNFIDQALKIHGSAYSYSRVNYTGASNKVEITCLLHGGFFQSPTAHIHGEQGCPSCATLKRLSSRKRKTQKQFVIEATKKHGKLYSYGMARYINLKTKVDIICNVHGLFAQTPKAHLRGQGCPSCANERRAAIYESHGERKISEWLTSAGLIFQKQKTYGDCKHKLLLRFDFYIPQSNVLIEFDGEQHYSFIPKFHKNQDGFKLMQTRDSIKTAYANKNGIELIRIPWNKTHKIAHILQKVLV